MATRLDSLAAIESCVWTELGQAAARPDHDWRTLALATTDGRRALARTVVLREADPETRELVFFTDARSAKVAQLIEHPQGTLLAWSKAMGWQLRLAVTLGVETEGLSVSSRWARLKLSPAAQDYLSPLAPGSPIAGPVEPARATRSHFAVVTARVHHVDWLELHADGQRRAGFGPDGARWLQP